jgi:hypothetical protein
MVGSCAAAAGTEPSRADFCELSGSGQGSKFGHIEVTEYQPVPRFKRISSAS